MRPVPTKYPTSQGFGSGATQGVDPNSSHPMAALVRMYGNYQPFGHAGEDIACPVGTPVQAMAAGEVLWADWGTNLPGDETEWGYRQRWYLYKGFPGIVTVIQHPGLVGIYAHLSNNDAAPAGTTVREGQVIGYSGDTGGVAPHLHREALVDLNYTTGGGLIYGRTDPTKYDGASGAALTAQSTTTSKELFTMAQYDDIQRQQGVSHEKLNNITAGLKGFAAAVKGYAIQNQKWHGQSHAKLNAVKSVVDQIAKKQNVEIDWDKVEEAAKAGAAEAFAEGVAEIDLSALDAKDAA